MDDASNNDNPHEAIRARCRELQGKAFRNIIWTKIATFEKDAHGIWLLEGDGTEDNPIRPADQADTPAVVEELA